MPATRSAGSLASLLLVQRLVESAADPLSAKEYFALLERVPNPEVMLGQTASTLAAELDIEPNLAAQVATRLETPGVLAEALETMEESGLTVVTAVDEDYPPSLRGRLRTPPPVLYLSGDASLLSAPMLGIVGSRNVDGDGAETAEAAARAAVRHGHGVVSGGAKGVDRISMQAALELSGIVVGVLADSLERAAREPEGRRAIAEGQVCLCSPYKPGARFTVGQAMGRNKVIYALSLATLVVASEEGSGGTWAGAKEALAGGIAPVVSWIGAGSGPGNVALVRSGALELSDIAGLFPLPQPTDQAPPENPSQQLALGL